MSIEQLWQLLNNQQNNMIILIVFLSLCASDIVLRIIVCMGYQTAYTVFKLCAKDVPSKEELKDTRSGLLNRIVKDYVKAGQKGIAGINTEAIVNKHVIRLSFAGWSYTSMERFIAGFEHGAALIGVLLAVTFDEYRFVYAIATVTAFILFRLLDSIFDCALVREKLVGELTEYVVREAGQFYSGDISAVITRYKNEVAAASLKQSEMMAEAISKLGEVLTRKREPAAAAVSSAAADPVVVTVADAASSAVASPIVPAGGRAAEQEYLEALRKISEQIADAAKVLGESAAAATAACNAVNNQYQYIEANQQALERSLQQYETSLETVAQKIGGGMGSIMEFHMQSAYGILNDRLQENIRQIINNNNELVQRVQQLIEQIRDQSRSETQAILKLKEQLDGR